MIGDPVLEGARRFGNHPMWVYGSSEVPISTATRLGEDTLSVDDGSPLPRVAVTLRGMASR